MSRPASEHTVSHFKIVLWVNEPVIEIRANAGDSQRRIFSFDSWSWFLLIYRAVLLMKKPTISECFVLLFLGWGMCIVVVLKLGVILRCSPCWEDWSQAVRLSKCVQKWQWWYANLKCIRDQLAMLLALIFHQWESFSWFSFSVPVVNNGECSWDGFW